ncbi:MAG: T9SS type A sorting domain-containing protein [Bacteroidota bacterium]
MKKIITFILLVVGIAHANAQITLSQADFGGITFHCLQSRDTLVDTAQIHVGAPGTNMTWNFMALHNNGLDSLIFMDPAATPYASNFATANVAFRQASSPGVFNFVNSASTGVTVLGQGLNQGNITNTTPNEAVPINPPMTFMNFPGTYNSTFSGSSHGTIWIDSTFTYSIFTVDTTRDEHHITYSSTIDAWGTITTQLGTFPALRQKYIEYTLDSIFVHTTTIGWQFSTIIIKDSSFIYRWFTNGQGYPIAELKLDTTWSYPRTATWMAPANVGTNDMKIAIGDIQLFPNPGNDVLNIINNTKSDVIISIYDVTGKLMDTQRLTGMTTKINTSSYANGLYSYRILGNDNTSLKTGKFAIVK